METYVGLLAVLVVAALFFFVVLFVWQGLRPREAASDEGDEWGPYVVRVYRGRQQSDAVRVYADDAEDLGARGYEPVSQSWGDGQWDAFAFVLALILSPFAIGLILLAYMAVIRPAGTLVVTYRRAIA